jgi:predicted SAM-dependent methyltransferase
MRWDLHFIRLRLRNWIGRQRGRTATFLAKRDRPLLLNLGAGPRGLIDGHWVNVDGFQAPNIHFLVDLQRGLPFPDGSFDGVFSEHVLEHFTKQDGLLLAVEVARVLRPGGVFRVVVPDGEFVMRSYFDDPEGLVRYRGSSGMDETGMDMVNSFFRQRYEHQFMYDWLTMKRLLEHAGFQDVLRCAFRESAATLGLEIDDEKYARESLYVEARKAPLPAALTPAWAAHRQAPLERARG